jgi:hypothetical protein
MKLNEPLFAVVTKDGTIVIDNAGWRILCRDRENAELIMLSLQIERPDLGPLRVQPVQIVAKHSKAPSSKKCSEHSVRH